MKQTPFMHKLQGKVYKIQFSNKTKLLNSIRILKTEEFKKNNTVFIPLNFYKLAIFVFSKSSNKKIIWIENGKLQQISFF